MFWELQFGFELSTCSALVEIMGAVGLELLKRKEVRKREEREREGGRREREERIREDETLVNGGEDRKEQGV